MKEPKTVLIIMGSAQICNPLICVMGLTAEGHTPPQFEQSDYN